VTSGPPRALWGRVLTDGRELARSRVVVAEGLIAAVDAADRPAPGDVVVNDGWIAPGLIDLQVNGAAGADLTSSSDPRVALEQVARVLAAHGVTAFCPTIVSSPVYVILARLASYRPRSVNGGAASLGTHVEGPFIDPAHRGVHEAGVLRDATRQEIVGWLEAGPPAIVTLAPERPGGGEAIAQLTEAGVVVSLGHSGADAARARAGLQAGARMATHLFNAMPPLHHRAPGLVGALLASKAVLGLIADGVHVDPLMVDLVINCAGPGRVALVSDCLAAAGAPPGNHQLGDQTVTSDGRVVRRADGTLAGSAMMLDGCLRNIRTWFPGLAPAAVVAMATSTPAALLGCTGKGRVAVGCDADLVVLDPDFNVVLTVVNGAIVGAATR
jgi:N-acetylglucosamine-6-phosphate deacetylase